MGRQCTHARRGIVTTHPDGPPIDGAHAARNCCDRPECIAAAQQWVASKAHRDGRYVPDGAR